MLSSSYDGTLAVHGLKAGKLLKQFRGHTSFANHAIYSGDGSLVISGGSDATVRVWDARTCACTQVRCNQFSVEYSSATLCRK